MGLGAFIKGGVREMMIARPDNLKHLIVYKHPDETVPAWSQLTVDADEGCVFFRDGRPYGILGAGRHTLSSQNIPFLGQLMDKFTGGNLFKAEIYFVLRRPVRDLNFGGRFEGIECPVTRIQADLRIFGTYVVQVINPTAFITEFLGQSAQPSADNNAMLGFVKDKMMMEFEMIAPEVLEESKMPLTRLARQKRALADRFKKGVPSLESIGLRVVDFGNFKVTVSPEDEVKIKARYDKMVGQELEAEADVRIRQHQLNQEIQMDERYANLAGQNPGYLARAQADALRDAGRGMAKGGGNAGVAGLGAQMAVGVGMAGMFQQGMYQPAQQYQRVAAPASGMLTCGGCGAKNPGGKFCASCGQPLAPPQPVGGFCSNCGQKVTGKFCASCGTPLAPGGGAPAQPAAGAPAQPGYPQAPAAGAPAQPGYPQAPAPAPAQPGYPQAPAPAQPGYPQAPAPAQPGYPQAPPGGSYSGGTPGGGTPGGGTPGGGTPGGGQQGGGQGGPGQGGPAQGG